MSIRLRSGLTSPFVYYSVYLIAYQFKSVLLSYAVSNFCVRCCMVSANVVLRRVMRVYVWVWSGECERVGCDHHKVMIVPASVRGGCDSRN